MTNVFILVGGSASGKTTVENLIIKNNLAKRIVSFCSREIRLGEFEGIDYYFRTPSEILSQKNVLEIHISPTWIYSVSEDKLLKDMDIDKVYSCINVQPAEDLLNFIKDNNIPLDPVIIFFDINIDQRIELLKARGETEDDIKLRLSREDTIDTFLKKPDFIISDIFSSYKEVEKIIKGFKICQ